MLDCNFTRTFDMKLGNCFTFNNDATLKVTQSGKQNGLRLELRIEKRKDYASITSTYGARVFIYNHSTLYTDSQGLDVPVGKETNIALSKQVSKSLKKPFSDCVINQDDDVNKKKELDIFTLCVYTNLDIYRIKISMYLYLLKLLDKFLSSSSY